MRWFLTVAFCIFGGIAPSVASDAHRHAGAHQHGHGRVNIAIEGQRLNIEIEAPGSDIVGFEHEAKTDKEKTAMTAARAQLANGAQLFEFPAAAGCQPETASVEVEGEGEHREFHASYAFKCTAMNKLTQIGFSYFKRFPLAEELDIAVASEKGQLKLEATPKKPTISLGALKK